MIIDDFSAIVYLIVHNNVPKIYTDETKVLYVRREINNHKTMKNVCKTKLNQNLRPKSMCMCVKYNIVCGMVFTFLTVF